MLVCFDMNLIYSSMPGTQWALIENTFPTMMRNFLKKKFIFCLEYLFKCQISWIHSVIFLSSFSCSNPLNVRFYFTLFKISSCLFSIPSMIFMFSFLILKNSLKISFPKIPSFGIFLFQLHECNFFLFFLKYEFKKLIIMLCFVFQPILLSLFSKFFPYYFELV